MLRLVTLVVALLGSVPFLFGPAVDDHRASEVPPAPDPGKRAVLNLPDGSAWVAAPYRAIGDVEVFGWATFPPQDDGARFSESVLLTIVEQREDGGVGFGGGGGVSSRLVEVNANGKRLVCCDNPIPYEQDPGESEFQTWLADGETLWVVFIGANVDASVPFDLSIGHRGGDLQPLLAREGTDVRALDLVDEANARGLNVGFGGQTLVGAPADVEETFRAARNGFASFSYYLSDRAPSSVRLVTDGEPIVERSGPGLSGMAYQLGGARFDVTYTPPPPAAPRLPGQQADWPYVSILFADLDVPGRTFDHYEWDNEG